MFNASSEQWTTLPTPSYLPLDLRFASAGVTSDGLVIFAGANALELLNDVWYYYPSMQRWVEVVPQAFPKERGENERGEGGGREDCEGGKE